MELKTAFVLADAPRTVPVSLKLTALFGGIGQFGWFFAGFGGLFAWVFAGQADVSALTFRGPIATAPGTILRVEETNASENERSVYAYHYEFAGPDGESHSGVSYQTSRANDPGDAVTVEYLASDPGKSRIQGMRRAIFSGWAAFVVLFPIIGVAIAFYRLLRGRKVTRLLGRGNLALGRLKEKRRTNTQVNNRTVWALTFEYEDQYGQTHEMTAKTTDPAVLEDEEAERLLYDPQRPETAVAFDDIPGRPRTDERGQWVGRGRGLVFILLPLAAVLGHLGYALARFGR